MSVNITKIRNEAAEAATRQGFNPDSNEGDAFRHMWASAVMTQIFNEPIAKKAGELIESLREFG